MITYQISLASNTWSLFIVKNKIKVKPKSSQTDLPLDDSVLKRISKEEFEEVWDSINKEQREVWLKQKDDLPLGTKIEGCLKKQKEFFRSYQIFGLGIKVKFLLNLV